MSNFCFIKKLLAKTCFVTIIENYAVVTKILILFLLPYFFFKRARLFSQDFIYCYFSNNGNRENRENRD